MRKILSKLLLITVTATLITVVVSGCTQSANNSNATSGVSSTASDQSENQQEFVYTTDDKGEVSLSKHNKAVSKNTETIVIPEAENGTLTKIDSSVFVSNTAVTQVTIPDTVQDIGDIAFKGCLNLQAVNFPKSLKSVGVGSFMGTALKEVTLPSTVTQIGTRAFSTCPKLEKLTVNEGVSVLNNICSQCKNLKELHLPSTITTVAEDFTVLPVTTVYTPNNQVVIDYCVANGINYEII